MLKKGCKIWTKKSVLAEGVRVKQNVLLSNSLNKIKHLIVALKGSRQGIKLMRELISLPMFRSLLEECTDMVRKSLLAYRSTAKQGHTHSWPKHPTSICYTA